MRTGILAILGTFLVRSGILESIHAFGASTLGIPFVALIVALIAGAIALVVWRLDLLRSEHRLDSLLSREAFFLFNNLVFVGLAFVVFFGTFFPLMTEALGNERSVGPPWFNRITVPLALALVGLAGLAPLLRLASCDSSPTCAAASPAPAAAGGRRRDRAECHGLADGSVKSLAMFGLAAFLIAGVAQELWRGTRVRRSISGEAPPLALVSLVRRNRRRYGGYTVHVGMALLFVGVAASSAFQHARDVRLRPGQTAQVGGYDVRYDRPTGKIDTRDGRIEKIVLGADLTVSRDGKVVRAPEPVARLLPAERAVRAGQRDVRRRGDERGAHRSRAACATSGPPCSRTSPRNLLPAAKRYDTALRRWHRERHAADDDLTQGRWRSVSCCSELTRRLRGERRRGELPLDLVAARRLDLDRRHRRLPRRPDRDLAGAATHRAGALRAGYAARVAQELGRARTASPTPSRRSSRAHSAPTTRGRARRPDRRGAARRRRRCSSARRFAAAPPTEAETDEIGRLAELEAEKEAKYREIRDAELDHRTGKLSSRGLEGDRPPAARGGGRDPGSDRQRRGRAPAAIAGRAGTASIWRRCWRRCCRRCRSRSR